MFSLKKKRYEVMDVFIEGKNLLTMYTYISPQSIL